MLVQPESPRAVVYMCGARNERPARLEAVEADAVQWGKDQGYEVIDVLEDDLVNWQAKHREELGSALELLANGEADVLIVPAEVYSQLRPADQKWLKASCEEYGGRVETMPSDDGAWL